MAKILKTKMKKGFTIIEVIIVTAITIILMSIIFVGLDPVRRFQESRNARRWSDSHTILEAIKKYHIDHEGEYFTTVANMTASGYYMIGTCLAGGDTGCNAVQTEAECVDLNGMGGTYLTEVPKDPKTGTDEKTSYYIMKWQDDAITVGACNAEAIGKGGSGEPIEIKLSR